MRNLSQLRNIVKINKLCCTSLTKLYFLFLVTPSNPKCLLRAEIGSSLLLLNKVVD